MKKEIENSAGSWFSRLGPMSCIAYSFAIIVVLKVLLYAVGEDSYLVTISFSDLLFDILKSLAVLITGVISVASLFGKFVFDGMSFIIAIPLVGMLACLFKKHCAIMKEWKDKEEIFVADHSKDVFRDKILRIKENCDKCDMLWSTIKIVFLLVLAVSFVDILDSFLYLITSINESGSSSLSSFLAQAFVSVGDNILMLNHESNVKIANYETGPKDYYGMLFVYGIIMMYYLVKHIKINMNEIKRMDNYTPEEK